MGGFGSTLPSYAGQLQLEPNIPGRGEPPPRDPAERDKALQEFAQYGVMAGLGAGALGLGGPEAMVMERFLPNMIEAMGAPSKTLNPPRTDVQGGYLYPLYHGTQQSFEEFDPFHSGDLGMHFGTLEQAQNRVGGRAETLGFKEPYYEKANVRPVWVDIKNAARLPDVFSTGSLSGALAKLQQWGMRFSQKNLLDAAIEARYQDPKSFWKVVQRQLEEDGFDGVVYQNEVEGAGDSFIAFHPHQVSSRFKGQTPNPRLPYAPSKELPRLPHYVGQGIGEQKQGPVTLDALTKEILNLMGYNQK